MVCENLARDKKYVVSAWLKNGIAANLILSVVLTAILTLLYFNIGYLGQPEELMPLIRPYYIISMVSVIFVTAKLGPVINGSMTVVTMLFGVFMDCLELLVAFIQAYVFTMLSGVFIGMSRQSEH